MSRQSPPTRGTAAASAADDARARYRLLTRWLMWLTVLAFGSFVLTGLLVLNRIAPGWWSLTSADSRAVEAKPGPWGRLEYVAIRIRPVRELVPQMIANDSAQIEWRFPNISSERFVALISEIDLSAPLRKRLLAAAEPDPEHNGFTVRPTQEVVLGLSPEDRASLYTAIASFPGNADQETAFRFCGDSLDQWLGNSPISRETRELVEPLVYRHGALLFFADLRSIEPLLPSPAERTALIKTLSCEATFLVRLEVTTDDDLDELVEYWGRGGREFAVLPILEAAQKSEAGHAVDVTYLLPPFARDRVYTYPVSPHVGVATTDDGFWTAMNFFSAVPDDRYSTSEGAARCLRDEYASVSRDLQLGDVVGFFDGDTLVHTAVYIADDVLFTKNGEVSSHPWMFMKLEDLRDYFPRRGELQVRYFRRKDL